MLDKEKNKFRFFSDLVNLRGLRWLVASGFALVVLWLPLDYFESYLYDFRLRLRPAPQISQLIETVLVDSASVQGLHGIPQIKDHLQFLNNLMAEQPKAIVSLINPKDLEGSDADKKTLANLLTSADNFYFVTDELAMKGEDGKLDLPGLFKSIPVYSGPMTSDTKILAQDGVTRRLMLSYQGNTLFHPYLVGKIIPGRSLSSSIHGHFDFYDSEQAYIDFAPASSFPHLGFAEVVAGKFSPGRFKNKIVIVGTDLGQSTHEYIKTPYSRQVTAMTLVEAHANVLNTLLLNSGVRQSHRGLNILILLILVILSVEVVLAMKPVKGLIVLGLTLLIFSLASFSAFWPFGIWVNMSQPILGIFIAYYFLIPYRLIIENRRGWELYQKNQLLTQVEELKTNFIGMMSHDLKTPLARIQGMLGLVMRDKNPLSEDQKEAVKSIQKSTDDLLHFITAILNFSRLESQGAQLNLKSKDINALIEDAIHKTDHLAREKNIKVETELEPLFSLRLDADLIRQVLVNLIENAIKYSPEKSEVRVRSEEKDGKVIVQIIDQGVGISADEVSRLFMKFFRSRAAKNSSVKGSGLGLYLSRYFVELHNGTLTAVSEEGRGSTFTIELPIKE